MLREFGIKKCLEKSCKNEMEELGFESLGIAYAAEPTMPAGISATGTSASSTATSNPTRAERNQMSY